ncbi:hypothetical protein NEF87_003543 [Candidatus Lokiarchaeum ossiferum]|uniref:Uncharacterized protein n=1 Tax=Candidatus Lokiarchaeum ossiferum TaxID=2951803 RepID=A0ABY6HUR7_9ARCH|nr:hypothetical protein NEF87_003543 [Candidatus Lokiarchaeum sp. B-35]
MIKLSDYVKTMMEKIDDIVTRLDRMERADLEDKNVVMKDKMDDLLKRVLNIESNINVKQEF